ncbi:hypothetical protein F4819DRAFT_461871 [Hypoxylon fuscum]|nr:hypothetical protein F4819DRAFT_461871 [Hypoxylon fuscum]
MTSYTTSHDSEPLPPGSFPITPSEQDVSLTSSGSQHQRNKLHKREDPRGWSGDEKATTGHQYTDSGVGLTDTGYTSNTQARDPATAGSAYNANKTAYDPNRTTALNQETTPNIAASSTARTTDHISGESKPGFMTGAHSRIDNSSNYKDYTQDTPAKPQSDTAGIGAVGTATGITTSATSDTNENEPGTNDRNIVRNGLRQTTNIDHTDPYWGDVPFGTGVYNGVTGHGSSEKPVDGSAHTHGTTLSHEQRKFPLETTDKDTRNETTPGNASRFKEGLTGSGTGVGVGIGAGLAASELKDNRREHQHDNEVKESSPRKHDDTEPKKEGIISALFHRDHKDEKKHETKEEKKANEPTPSKNDSPLMERDAGAALAAATVASGTKDHADKHEKKPKESDSGLKGNTANALYQHPNEKVANKPAQGTTTQIQGAKDPFVAAGYTGPSNQNTTTAAKNTHPASQDVTTKGPSLVSRPAEKSTEEKDSRLGYGLAGAGAGAGAGYAAHKYANKNDDKHKQHATDSSYTPTTTSKTATHPGNSGYTIGEPQSAVISGTTKSTSPSEKQTRQPASTDTNTARHNTDYKTLADGTPSGVNTSDHHVVSSPTTAHNAATKDSHYGTKAAAAGAGTVGAGAAAAHYAGKRENDSQMVAPESQRSVAPNSKVVHEPYMETAGAGSHAPTTSTHDDTYMTMSSGTTSGMNVGNDQYHGSAKGISSSPTTTAPSAANRDTHNGAKAATAAGVAGVAGAGAAAATHRKDETKAPASSDIRNQQPGVAHNSSNLPRGVDTSNTSVASSNRASSDSSHGGQYKVLSSGTPSGINIDDHDQQGSKSLEHTTKAPSQTAHHASTVADSTPKKEIAGATAGVATAGATAAATPTTLKSGDKVFHRCKKCGEDNDISGYFQRHE